MESVNLVTTDGVELSATTRIDADIHGPVPAVIFIHQGGSSKEEWVSLPIFNAVADAGMCALAFDRRGHGESGGDADFSTLFDDPNQSPRDLEAALEWLERTGQVDMDRVAVVGASIGANLAVVAAGSSRFDVRSAVAISGKTSAALNLAGGDGYLEDLKTVFMISSELEQGGQRALWATEMYEMSAQPRRLEIVPGSRGHGVSVIADDPSLQKRILDWLIETL